MKTGKIMSEGFLKYVKVKVIESWIETEYPHYGTRLMKVSFLNNDDALIYGKGNTITIPAYDFQEDDPFMDLVKKIKPIVNFNTKTEIRDMFLADHNEEDIYLAFCFAKEITK